MRKNIALIVEPNHDGHRMGYVRMLADWALRQQMKVSVATSQVAPSSSEWNVHLADLGDRLMIHTGDYRQISAVESLSRAVEPSVTVIPDGDRHLAPLALRGWHGTGLVRILVMRPDAEPRRLPGTQAALGVIRKSLMLAADRQQAVAVFGLKSGIPSHRTSLLRWVSDPVGLEVDESLLRSLREQLAEHGVCYWVGVFGYVSDRKNLDLVARAVVGLPGVGLLVVGVVSDSAWQKSKSDLQALQAEGRFRHVPGPVDGIFLDSAIAAVDCVIAAHSNGGPSGVVARAAATGRQLVLAGSGTLRMDAKAMPAHAQWVHLTVGALRTAIAVARSRHAEDPLAVGETDAFAARLLNGVGE